MLLGPRKITASDGESLQYVIYENSTFGIRIEFPRQWEFEVADNLSENPLRVVYFYNNPADLLGDFVIWAVWIVLEITLQTP